MGADFSSYVGIPYLPHGRSREGVDCWGLLWLVYREQFEIDLPSYALSYVDPSESDEISTLIQGEIPETRWRLITVPSPGDGVLLRAGGSPSHVGVYVGDGRILHSRIGHAVCVSRLDSMPLRMRVEGFYRWL